MTSCTMGSQTEAEKVTAITVAKEAKDLHQKDRVQRLEARQKRDNPRHQSRLRYTHRKKHVHSDLSSTELTGAWALPRPCGAWQSRPLNS